MFDIRIVISALNRASGDIQKLKGDIKDVGKTSKEAKGGVEGFGASISSVLTKAALATGAVAAVGVAVKQVYDAMSEGAELEYARARFDNLTESIGTTSDALLDDLREATHGMVSDSELVASAADFMALGLADSAEEVVRLATVAGALHMNMNQLVLTLTNKTTMRFDALGVSVEGFDAKVKALEESGMSADEAFSEAFLQQAEEQIKKVGDASDYTIGNVDRFEASLKNLGDSAKTALTPLVNQILPPLTGYLDDLGKKNTFIQMSRDLEELGINIDGLTEPYTKWHGGIEATNDSLLMQTESVEEWANSTYKSFIATGSSADEAREKLIYLWETFGVGAIASNEWADANYEGAQSAYDHSDALKNQNDAMMEVKDATNDANEAMRSYSESLLFKIASEGLSAEAAYDLAEAMGLVDNKTVAATEQTSVYKSMLESGAITQREYNLLVEALATDLENLPEGETIEIEDNVDEVLEHVEELQSWRFKPIPLKLDVDDSSVRGYSPPTKTGRVIYQTQTHMAQAVGGSVNAGEPYTWQEYGYRGEVFVPSADGFVLSRADAERALARALYGGGGGGNGSIDPEALGKAIARALSGVAKNNGGGNVYNLTMPTSSNPADVRTAFELMEAWA